MKILNIKFDITLPHKTNLIRIPKWKFCLPDHGFSSDLPRILRSSGSGIYALLILMMSVFLFSCEQDTQITKEPEKSELLTSKDFSEMTEAELLEYFKNYEFGEMGSSPVSFEITERDVSSPASEIQTRNSLKCDVEITLTSRSTSSTDSAILEIYENDNLVDSFKIFQTPKFLWEIDDANEYQYKIIPLGDTSDPKFYFQVGLKYGAPWVFNIFGEFTTQPFNYTCPEPTGGMCEVEWEISKYAGDATQYEVFMMPTDNYFPAMQRDTLYPGVPVNLIIDSNRDYNILIYPSPGSSREFFRFLTSTPYLNVALTFDLDMTDPNQQQAEYPNFDYYDCP